MSSMAVVLETMREAAAGSGGARSGGGGCHVVEAVPDRAGEDASTRGVVQPGEHDRAAADPEYEADDPNRWRTAEGVDGEEER